MGLVVATCFQHNPSTQPQAFTVLGQLASEEVDDDLVYQILVAMSTTLGHYSESDATLVISMLRCLSRIISGLLPDSRYAGSLFWLAVGVCQLGYIPVFSAALELMKASLRSMAQSGAFAPGLAEGQPPKCQRRSEEARYCLRRQLRGEPTLLHRRNHLQGRATSFHEETRRRDAHRTTQTLGVQAVDIVSPQHQLHCELQFQWRRHSHDPLPESGVLCRTVARHGG
jgi:hypothetical protein